uniref:Uncharacterized protein n=1 Tax=Eutreptiella gymnastica TaxID=73025 RepID=A0A7S1J6L3_9EUGL|mmetsp:Transcript_72076/g.127020  ORF Transcript_72076/g.127020 Transcript_72076/m.127020 type:complete len:295 (+) Transcript_72076:222-1106(+)
MPGRMLSVSASARIYPGSGPPGLTRCIRLCPGVNDGVDRELDTIDSSEWLPATAFNLPSTHPALSGCIQKTGRAPPTVSYLRPEMRCAAPFWVLPPLRTQVWIHPPALCMDAGSFLLRRRPVGWAGSRGAPRALEVTGQGPASTARVLDQVMGIRRQDASASLQPTLRPRGSVPTARRLRNIPATGPLDCQMRPRHPTTPSAGCRSPTFLPQPARPSCQSCSVVGGSAERMSGVPSLESQPLGQCRLTLTPLNSAVAMQSVSARGETLFLWHMTGVVTPEQWCTHSPSTSAGGC